MLAIIGGSGFYYLGKEVDKIPVITPYGNVEVIKAKLYSKDEVLFIPRHGEDHSIPPHKVNYRANIYALQKLGASAAFATYASGTITNYKPGDLVLLEDFLGFNTPITFFDDFSAGLKHFDFTEPFDKDLQNAVLEIANSLRIKIKKGGVVATTTGPRFETKAEIKALKKLGANLVNMTSAYEITLFHEMEIPFAAMAVATNYACGISKKRLSTEEVMEQMNNAKPKINLIINGLVDYVR